MLDIHSQHNKELEQMVLQLGWYSSLRKSLSVANMFCRAGGQPPDFSASMASFVPARRYSQDSGPIGEEEEYQ